MAETLQDRVEAAGRALREGRRAVYLYWGDVDHVGHSRGFASPEWVAELEHLDAGMGLLARTLPKGTLLVVTADHGMVDVGERIDVSQEPGLAEGVELLAGEERALHVYTGDAARLAERWRGILGGRALVMTKDEALGTGVFGRAGRRAYEAMGDVVSFQASNLSVVDGSLRPPGARAWWGSSGVPHPPGESLVPAHRGDRVMAELVFFSGTMDCGKSTLALQTAYNYERRGMRGLVYTRNDRAGHGRLSSRIGLESRAAEVDGATDFWQAVLRERAGGRRVDFLICDEVQFYTPDQVEQLACVVDDEGIDVYGFGIASDFRTRLFPGSARMIELADRVEVLQVRSLCWCGKRATHNARTVGGVMVTEGEQVVVGDVDSPDVGYEVLCRYHHRKAMTAATARAARRIPGERGSR